MGNRLFVGSLSWNTTSEELQNAFAACGDVVEAKVVTDRDTGRSRGFGFVTLGSSEDARNAIEAAGRKPEDIDLIVVATTTPDKIFPSTACLLQRRLGIHGCAAFDVQAVCTGFVYALGVADQFIFFPY